MSEEHGAAGSVPSHLVGVVASAVSAFGATVKVRLTQGVGEPEDQMRGPLETLFTAVADDVGVKFAMMGEASLADLKVRPDYAVAVNGAISGYIEVKAPGKGADPTRWKPTTHDGRQWSKLSALPNVLYTDGEEFSLWRTGELVGRVVRLKGDIRTAGAKLTTHGDDLARILSDFLHWEPVPPRSIGQLVHTVAPLTRLLRDEVIDTMAREHKAGGGPFTALASDWRDLLFPSAPDDLFADGYSQSIAFALLLARNDGIDFSGKSVAVIAAELGRTHALLGKALAVLTDETIGALSVTLGTLVRVISVIDFDKFGKDKGADPYLALYETFLAEYDAELRKQTGSYYTPMPVVAAMTQLTEQVLRSRLGCPQGLATRGITILDPAMGTGTFVLEALETIAENVRAKEGPGAIPARLTEAASRVVGIEKQTGPFAVAEMRVADILHRYGANVPVGGLRLFVADSLDDPFAEQSHLAATLEPLAASRRGANRAKSEDSVFVVIGNPPYREHAKGQGGFIEKGAPNTDWAKPLLDAFREDGNGGAEYVLSNLYIYFWRLATWEVFDAHPDTSDGVVCFISTSGYMKGPGFAGMRRYLREKSYEGWVIDATPEGFQPDVATRIFGGVQQPVAIGIFARRQGTDETTPAPIHYRAIHGRQAEKFDQLKRLDIDDDEWEDCPTDWTAPFLPAGGDEWDSSPQLSDLLPWYNQGVVAGRTWVYAPLPGTLNDRWNLLMGAGPDERASMFRESRDATVTRKKPGLAGFPHADRTIAEEHGPSLMPTPIAYRSFDVQYLIPDDRVMSTPRTDLWRVRGEHQFYITEPVHRTFSGPAVTFTAHTPDIDHYNGRGGRVLPLYAGPSTDRVNLAPGLLEALHDRLGVAVEPEDVVAYIAAVTSHPDFTERFAEDLRTPGIRIPVTTDPVTWADAVELGRRVLWLHTRGERQAGPGRPPGAPEVRDTERRPLVAAAIPESPMPDDLEYDEDTKTLRIGEGAIAPVLPRVAAYEVNGMNVLRKWFGYRRSSRPKSRGDQSPLDDLRPTTWPSEYTTDLLELLHTLTLVTDLEPAQVELLDRVMAGPRLTVDELTAAGVLPVPDDARSLPKGNLEDPVQQLWLLENEARMGRDG